MCQFQVEGYGYRPIIVAWTIDHVMKMVQVLNELVTLSEATLVIPVSSEALKPAELEFLRGELHPVNEETLNMWKRGLEKVN